MSGPSMLLLGGREDLLDLGQQLFEREGLADVVDRPLLQPLHPVLGLGSRRQHRDRDVRGLLVDAQQLQHLPAVHLRHHDVEQHQVRPLDLGLGQRLVPAARRDDVVALLAQHQLEKMQYVGLVVDDEYLLLVRQGPQGYPGWEGSNASSRVLAGSQKRKVVPLPRPLSTLMLAPWASRMLRTIDSPSPTPP